jgi:hypothetical protein
MTALLTRVGTQARAAEPGILAGRGRLREACHRIRVAVREVSCASGRVAGLPARWGVDMHWHGR